jgi:hypothetical protein
MAIKNVHTAFTLSKDDGSKVQFVAGAQDVPDELLDHWYVKAHVEDLPEPAEKKVPKPTKAADGDKTPE